MNEIIKESILWWFGHVEGKNKNRIAERVYEGKYMGSYPVDRLRKGWTDSSNVI